MNETNQSFIDLLFWVFLLYLIDSSCSFRKQGKGMNSKLASVENLWQVKEQVKNVEMIAEEVLSLKNQVLALNKQKDQARLAWRALQKTNDQTVWLNFGKTSFMRTFELIVPKVRHLYSMKRVTLKICSSPTSRTSKQA